MNYLAHIYLSKNVDNLIIGNFIADFIRGNKYKHLPSEIQNGILLHRQIDSFTDANTIVRKSKRRLHERYGHYDGIIIDIFFDHFLAKNWDNYTAINLQETENKFLNLMNSNLNLLPEKVKNILPYIASQHWLVNYANFSGIEKTLIGMNKRTKNKSKMNLAITDLKLHYTEFENDFFSFFKEIQVFSKQTITNLRSL